MDLVKKNNMDTSKAKYIEFINEMGLLDFTDYDFPDGTQLCKDDTFIELDGRTVAHCSNDLLIIHVCTETNYQVHLTGLVYKFDKKLITVMYYSDEYNISNKEDYFNLNLMVDLSFSYDDIQQIASYYDYRNIGSRIYFIDGDEKYTGEIP